MNLRILQEFPQYNTELSDHSERALLSCRMDGCLANLGNREGNSTLEGCLRKKGHFSVYGLLKQLNITPRSNTPLSSGSRMNIVLASDNILNLGSSKVTKLLLDQVPGGAFVTQFVLGPAMVSFHTKGKSREPAMEMRM